MVTIINLLILFFILLIVYQTYLNYFRITVVEGLSPNSTVDQVYTQYDKKISDNTFLLAQQNAGNIEYLKERVNNIQDMADEVNQLSSDVDSLQQQVNGLVQANADYTSQNLGTTPPDISGAVDSNTTSSSTDFVT